MSTKDKWIIFSIITVLVISVIAFVKLAPFWVSIAALGSLVFGLISGWVGRKLYTKYVIEE